MTPTGPTNAEYETALAEAIEWTVTFAVDDVRESDVNAFHQWRSQHPLNARIYAELASNSRKLRDAASTYRQDKISRRALLSGGGATIAAIAAIGLASPPLGLWPSLAELMADHRTGVGERFAFVPSVGVKVEMNSRTSVALLDGGAGMKLVDGEAFVTVKRPLGFRIEALGANVSAIGATLNVETLNDTVRVTCMSGNARCMKGRTDTVLGPNEQISLAGDGSAVRSSVPVEAIASWRSGKLVFVEAPLREVIAQLNRYRSGSIVLTDSAKQYQPVTAVFFTDQIDSALGQLQRVLSLNSRALPGGIMLIS